MRFFIFFRILYSLTAVFCDVEITLLHHSIALGHYSGYQYANVSTLCTPSQKKENLCVGGFPRIRHLVVEHRKEAEASKDSRGVLYLYSGSTLMGSIWHRVHKEKIAADFFNLLKPDAMVLGSTDFCGRIGMLSRLLATLKVPVLGANLITDFEPGLETVKSSITLNIGKLKVGIIGYAHRRATDCSPDGNFTLADLMYTMREEAEKLEKDGAKLIIALGSDSLYADTQIAKGVKQVDIVVGGQPGILFYNGKPSIPYADVKQGYPKIVKQSSGKRVPVVQTTQRSTFLGRLNLTVNDNGDVIKIAGQPIFLSSKVEEDPEAFELLQKFQGEVDAKYKVPLGSTTAYLEGDRSKCMMRECNFNNLATDAMIEYVSSNDPVSSPFWTNAAISFLNSRSITSDIDPSKHSGQILTGEIMDSLPFDNDVVLVTITGDELFKMLEASAAGARHYLHYSGLKVVYDITQPVKERVIAAKVRCAHCDVPQYLDLNVTSSYNIVTLDFMLSGAKDYEYLKAYRKMSRRFDKSNVDMVMWYIQKYSPVFPEEENRIVVKSQREPAFGSRICMTSHIFNVICLTLAFKTSHIIFLM